MIDIHKIQAFKDCYIMQPEDIGRFADTLADGFCGYDLFNYICNGNYNKKKMSASWAVSIALHYKNAICIADSKDANSVLIYVRPKSKEPGPLEYVKVGGLKTFIKLGIKSTLKLLQFDAQAQKVAKHYRTDNCGYLVGFATRIEKQGQKYGKYLMQALLNYLDATGEECYLETFKAANVGLYNHFSFQLKEQIPSSSGNLTMYAMHRPARYKEQASCLNQNVPDCIIE